MKISTGTLFLTIFGGARPPLLGLDDFALGVCSSAASDSRIMAFDEGDKSEVICGKALDDEDFSILSCGLLFVGDGFGDDAAGAVVRDLGGLMSGSALTMLEGLVKAFSRFSLSSVVGPLGRSSAACSIFLFLGAIIGVIRVLGSMGLGDDAARCSSTRARGALEIVVAVGLGFNAISRAVMIPVGLLGC